MAKTALKILLAAAVLMILSGPANADSIITFSGGSSTCGGSNCFGNVLTLTIHPLGGSNYQVTLAINTSGNTNVGTALAGVNFKFGSGITSATLTQAPGGVAGWASGVYNSLNASGCNQGAAQGFGCSEDSNFVSFNVTQSAASPAPAFPIALAALPNAGTYTWIWNVTANGTVTGNQVHVGALFGHIDTGNPSGSPTNRSVNYSYQQNGLISASGTTVVPEPGTLALFGMGLLGLAGVVRRRIRK